VTIGDIFITIVSPILTVLFGAGGLVSWYQAHTERVKTTAEREKVEAEREKIEAGASETITATALSLIEPLKQRITDIEAERVELLRRVAVLETELCKANALIEELRADLGLAQARITELEQERDGLREQVACYREIVERHGIETE
jgi:chromosome segregation ATPase